MLRRKTGCCRKRWRGCCEKDEIEVVGMNENKTISALKAMRRENADILLLTSREA